MEHVFDRDIVHFISAFDNYVSPRDTSSVFRKLSSILEIHNL